MAGVLIYDEKIGVGWKWQSCDGSMVKAPLALEAVGPNPTDRGKQGTKRSVLTDGYGIPLVIVIAGANINDHLMLKYTLAARVVSPPPETEMNLCLDKGYDYPRVPGILSEHAYIPHVRTRGDEVRDLKTIPGYHPRRWVVERIFAWLNRFRRILVRWEKKEANYLAMLQFACTYILFHAAEVSG